MSYAAPNCVIFEAIQKNHKKIIIKKYIIL